MKKELKGFIVGCFMSTIGLTSVFAAGNIKSAQFNSNQVIFNGNVLDLSSQPMVTIVDNIGNESNYMPIRAVLEQMGYYVGWDDVNNAVIISYDDIFEFELESESIPESETEPESIINTNVKMYDKYPTAPDFGSFANSKLKIANEKTKEAMYVYPLDFEPSKSTEYITLIKSLGFKYIGSFDISPNNPALIFKKDNTSITFGLNPNLGFTVMIDIK